MKHLQEKNKKLMEEMGWEYGSDRMGWIGAHLAEEVGETVSLLKFLEDPAFKKLEREALLEQLEDELCDVIGLCTRIGVKYDLDLEAAMNRNHDKIRKKFGGKK